MTTHPDRFPAAPAQLFPLTRHFSYRITPLLLPFPITPNQVTAASLLFGVAGGTCFLFGQWGWDILGALLLVLSYTLDNCDGEIARVKNLYSAFGAKFDDLADSLVDAVFFAMLGIGTSESTGNAIWMWLGFAATAGAVIDYTITIYKEAQRNADPSVDRRDADARDPKKPQDAIDWIFYTFHEMSRAEFCNIILLLALFNVTWVLLPLGAAGAQIYWITALLPKARGWHV
ncbi:MAG: CDP-alcohol phosphatidyltransferase family protein [Gammaproteobacteria bacterium]